MAAALSQHSDNVLVELFGQVTSLGVVYNEAQMIGTRFAALACAITAHSIWIHWRRNACPQVRSCIIRILLLVPVYAIDAALGLQRTRNEVPRQLLRQAYEAYVLLCFLRLMLLCLGDGAHGGWCSFSPFAKKGCRGAVDIAKLGVWQYVMVCGVLNTSVALLAWAAGAYHDGLFVVGDAYPYCSAVQFVSQSWALWAMVNLLHCTQRDLAPARPVLKFMCIKLLIFFTWMQTVAILMLENVSSLGRLSLWIETEHRSTVSHWWDPLGVFDATRLERHRTDAWLQPKVRSEVGTGLGNFVLCLEMVAFAVLHCCAYRVSEWDASDPGCSGLRLLAARRSQLEAPLLGRVC